MYVGFVKFRICVWVDFVDLTQLRKCLLYEKRFQKVHLLMTEFFGRLEVTVRLLMTEFGRHA